MLAVGTSTRRWRGSGCGLITMSGDPSARSMPRRRSIGQVAPGSLRLSDWNHNGGRDRPRIRALGCSQWLTVALSPSKCVAADERRFLRTAVLHGRGVLVRWASVFYPGTAVGIAPCRLAARCTPGVHGIAPRCNLYYRVPVPMRPPCIHRHLRGRPHCPRRCLGAAVPRPARLICRSAGGTKTEVDPGISAPDIWCTPR